MAARPKRQAREIFRVTETNLDAHAQKLMHDPGKPAPIKPKGEADAGEGQRGVERQVKGRPGHYTYI